MNRHSPLFRVAFLSLLLAISLPLLVFCAANVRHRQLSSTANPRWAKFKEVNGGKDAEKPVQVARTSSPPVRNAVEVRPSPESQAVVPGRLQTKTISQSKGMTGSATGNLAARNVAGEASQDSHSVPVKVPSDQPRPVPNSIRLQQKPPRQLAQAPVSDMVPTPDDMPVAETPVARPSVKPRIEFRAVDESTAAGDSSSRLEAKLAGLQRRLDLLAQAQVEKQMSDVERALIMLQEAQKQAQQVPQQQPFPRPFDPPAPVQSTVPAAPIPNPPVPQRTVNPGPAPGSATGREPTIKIVQGDVGDNDERFSIQVQDANLTEVLEMLGQLAGVNILNSRDVQGKISLNLQDVTVDKALDAVLKSQGFIHEREGDFIYVRSATEDAALKQANRKLITKVYQLHYVNGNEVQKLIDPVLTKSVGRHAVTSPAQVGIAPSQTNSGGDGLSQRDTLLVQDYPEVIAEIDRIIIEIDVPPLQVLIEAKILSVALSDSMAFGVNFAMLNGAHNSQLLTGNGQTLNGAVGFPANGSLVPPVGDFIANTAGLKYGFIQGDVSGFIKAIETIADTTLVAAPQLRVLNKQRAEMIIGQRLSYKTLAFNGTQTVENVQFLDAGTKLIFRPFISPDGLVRLEVHPERSKATINESTGLPNSETTEVTTNVMVRDGTTVVLGGLISEESTESIERVPFLGAIPWLGVAFRNKTEQVQRNEMIVLLTPRIVTEPEAAIEGEKLQFETEERAAYFRDNLSVVNRTSLTRAHYERAMLYFEQGSLLKAKQQIDAALLQNKGDLECQRLKLKIDQALRDQQASAWRWPLSRKAARKEGLALPQ